MMIFKNKTLLLSLFIGSSLTLYAGNRDQTTEFFFIPQYIDGKTLDFQGEVKADIDSSVSFGLGFGYNFDPHFNLGVLFSYADANYKATYYNEDGNLENKRHTLYTSSINLVGTYNFLEDDLTPFVSAHIGYTYTNTGISNGEYYWSCPPPIYPFPPGYCYPYEGAYSENSFNYGGFAGVRYDFEHSHFFIKGAVGLNVIDYDSQNTADFLIYQLTLGTTF